MACLGVLTGCFLGATSDHTEKKELGDVTHYEDRPWSTRSSLHAVGFRQYLRRRYAAYRKLQAQLTHFENRMDGVYGKGRLTVTDQRPADSTVTELLNESDQVPLHDKDLPPEMILITPPATSAFDTAKGPKLQKTFLRRLLKRIGPGVKYYIKEAADNSSVVRRVIIGKH